MISSEIFDRLGIDPALIMAIIVVLLLILILIILFDTVKINRLQSRYDLFMRGRDGITLEDNIVEIYRKMQLLQSRNIRSKPCSFSLKNSLQRQRTYYW